MIYDFKSQFCLYIRTHGEKLRCETTLPRVLLDKQVLKAGDFNVFDTFHRRPALSCGVMLKTDETHNASIPLDAFVSAVGTGLSW